MNERRITRRTVLKAGIATAVGGAAIGLVSTAFRNRPKVHIQKVASYQQDISAALLESFDKLGLSKMFAGKRVMLKPNLVETAPIETAINTHPAVVVGAADAIRRLDARAVFVGEGAGHRRDTELVLDQSQLGDALDRAELSFVDLNLQQVRNCPNRTNRTNLGDLYLPEPMMQADVIVSMAKLKTHHWAGATLSMKNLFGVMPGIVYGWPKNRLHVAGLTESIVDINATVAPHLAIVDGIVGMEGDGPIMGDAKQVGVLVVGTNFPAVDATCCRIMGLDPARIEYLKLAERSSLGPTAERSIHQTGAAIGEVVKPFRVLDHLAHMSLC